LRSPIIAGSAAITDTAERMRRAEEFGAGAVVMKSFSDEAVMRSSPTPRFRILRRQFAAREAETLYSYEQAPPFTAEQYAEEIRRSKGLLTIPLIASIDCLHEQNWVPVARMVEAAGAEALELNVSCPHGSIAFSGQEVEAAILRVARSVRAAVNLPLIVKLSPQLTAPLNLIRELEKTGVQGVVLFNRFTGLEIDVEREAPILHGSYAGHGGAWALHYTLRWVSAAAPVTSLDISASGGVVSGDDVVKLLLAGATTVQTCSAIIIDGYRVLETFNLRLREWMEQKGYSSIEEFRGKIHGRIKTLHQVDRRKQVVAEIKRRGLSPCQAACPLGVRANGYIDLIAQGKFLEAAYLAREKNPLSSVCGYVCARPCETACLRGRVDAAVAIAALKRFAHEQARELQRPRHLSVAPPTGKRVAIIGSGPAGLTAAHDLAIRGHSVTIFEAAPIAGGMLSLTIPPFRLPREALREEIQAILDLGVELRLSHEFRTGREILALLECPGGGAPYDAVLLAFGCHKSRRLNLQGESLPGVLTALEFLKSVNLG